MKKWSITGATILTPDKKIIPCPLIIDNPRIKSVYFESEDSFGQMNRDMDDFFADIQNQLGGICGTCTFKEVCFGGCLAEKLSFERNFEDEQIEEQKADYGNPGLDDHVKFFIEFPAPPGTVELKRLKGNQAENESDYNQAGVVVAPGNPVPVHQRSQIADHQKAVDQVQKPGH